MAGTTKPMANSVRNSAVEWFTVSKGPHTGRKLLVGSARVVTEGGATYQVEAAEQNRGRGSKLCVWSGIDPFTAADVATKINAGGVPAPEPEEEYCGVMGRDDPADAMKPVEE